MALATFLFAFSYARKFVVLQLTKAVTQRYPAKILFKKLCKIHKKAPVLEFLIGKNCRFFIDNPRATDAKKVVVKYLDLTL